MLLRDHPLMSYRGRRNWPPRWLPGKDIGGEELSGEIGALVEVVVSSGTITTANCRSFFFSWSIAVKTTLPRFLSMTQSSAAKSAR